MDIEREREKFENFLTYFDDGVKPKRDPLGIVDYDDPADQRAWQVWIGRAREEHTAIPRDVADVCEQVADALRLQAYQMEMMAEDEFAELLREAACLLELKSKSPKQMENNQ